VNGRLACGVAAAVVVVILVLTLTPTGAAGGTESLSVSLRFRGFRSLADTIANVLLFLPFGMAAAACRRGRAAPILAGFALSAFIELTQLFIPGRYSSPWDLAFNTVGAALGVALLRTAPIWLRPAGVLRLILPATAFTAALVVIVGGGFFFAPVTIPGPLVGQWTHVFEGAPVYHGRLLEARVGNVPVHAWPVSDSDALRAALFRDTTRLRVEAGPPPRGAAPLFAVAAPAQQAALLNIAVDGHDVLVSYRMRARAAGLDQPNIRVAGALAPFAVGDTFDLLFWRDGAGHCLRVDDTTWCGMGFTAADTWSLLLFPIPQPLGGMMPFLWPLALLLPAGFWIRRPAIALAAAAAAALAIALAPAIVPVLPAPPAVLLAAAGGVLMGFVLRNFVTAGSTARPIPRPEAP
jgi:VanZ family protein